MVSSSICVVCSKLNIRSLYSKLVASSLNRTSSSLKRTSSRTVAPCPLLVAVTDAKSVAE